MEGIHFKIMKICHFIEYMKIHNYLHRQHIYQLNYAILRVSTHIASRCAGKTTKFAASPIMQISTRSRLNRLHRERKEKEVISLSRPE